MPTYTYQCSSCEYTFDIEQRMSDKPLKKCKECGKYKLGKILYAPMVFVKMSDSEITKLGHLAERNSEKMSSDQKMELTNKYKTKKQDKLSEKGFKVQKQVRDTHNWINSVDDVDSTKIASASPEKQKDYIERGVKP